MFTRIFTAILVGTLLLGGCVRSNLDASSSQLVVNESVARIRCGSASANVSIKISKLDNEPRRFAILLAGSPVTNYFSEENHNAKELTAMLIKEGFAVAEVKYPQQGGFYGACRAQGIANVMHHSGELYDVSMEMLGADPMNSEHKIVGIGVSIGAAQLQAMAFMLGKRVDKIALTGVLVGDVAQGCKSFLEGKSDGYTWKTFHRLATALTKNQKGCYPPSEYSSSLNFENQLYADQGHLAIFEGEVFGTQIPPSGNIDQARYIEAKRRELGAPVSLFTYPRCGHEVLVCSEGQARDDIFDFVTRDGLIKRLLRVFGF